MKDKLVRYNHKAIYYTFKKVFICCSAIVATSILIALPISLGLNLVKANENTNNIKTNVNTNVELLRF